MRKAEDFDYPLGLAHREILAHAAVTSLMREWYEDNPPIPMVGEKRVYAFASAYREVTGHDPFDGDTDTKGHRYQVFVNSVARFRDSSPLDPPSSDAVLLDYQRWLGDELAKTASRDGFNPLRPGSRLHLPRLDLRGANLDGIQLGSAWLGRADLSGASLRKAKLDFAHLEYAQASGTDFTEANVDYASLNSIDAASAVFRGATLYDVNLAGGRFDDADFTNAWPVRANMEDADFTRANFSGAALGRRRFGSDELEPSEDASIDARTRISREQILAAKDNSGVLAQFDELHGGSGGRGPASMPLSSVVFVGLSMLPALGPLCGQSLF